MSIFQNNLEERIANAIVGPIESLGYELVRVKIISTGKHNTLQIMFDKVNGTAVNIEDCKKVHYTISPLLDVEDIIEDKYTLEVSSPGVNRPLTRDKDFINYIGYAIKLTTKIPIGNRRRFKGVLKEFSNNELSIELKDNNGIIKINKNNIMEANLLFEKEETLWQ
ncbi:MAG: Ribosome maturation factor RimP [Candidatus Midichloria mitochondrii]|uniref:Ribosome maturation factor RimP n=1 Tax=Midichloria mitochondrii (strain IricVA) TaxID=696127 RepID=F7XVT2_MIDMI|nr:ribosome maturation factor RimP [Candidatus Midichloria mitochondrii]AEI88781.1 Uncharacterized protein conserved in bacteria [Candidatus Midichloria mitochondrii IricVA]MDJ1287799.1 ribosome maturation factor RimP [Candidatus Midichloria mitochondrii]MDJ1298638.1 ribosome maturation factor RimP [Candidatus Midichloria mitochondrii]MDJ1312567.1 ribosome maturation factor RimP [Candidatus Midichloria mitochondrii]MDJ1583084.1 ribosome maturation factor RimP [Candidatus Midichloria mitochondr